MSAAQLQQAVRAVDVRTAELWNRLKALTQADARCSQLSTIRSAVADHIEHITHAYESGQQAGQVWAALQRMHGLLNVCFQLCVCE